MENIFDENVVEDTDLVYSACRQAKVAPGIYEYWVKSVTKETNVPTQYGLKDRVNITYSLYTTEGEVDIIDKINISTGSDSRFMKLITLLSEVFQSQQVNLRDFIGTTGELEIELVESKDGVIFEKIASMRPSINMSTEA